MNPPSHPTLPRYLWREYDARGPHPEEAVHLPHKGPAGPRRMVAWVHEPEEEYSLAWLAVTVPA